MTGEQVNREMEIRMMRKDLLKLNPLKRLSEINNLYFDGKITDEEHDAMKDWYFGR